jgi:16S rRNA (guanine966-N2)-methyltransferase
MVKSAKVRHTVRIIGGLYKRTPIPVIDAAGLRPSPDRVRETVFNWVGQDLTGLTCLDLFAGTGVLGFEAASRGAQTVYLVESHPAVVAGLRATQAKLKPAAVQILAQDALVALARLQQNQLKSLDLVFLDPPFDQGWYAKVLPLLALLIKPNGFLYLESREPWPAVIPQLANHLADHWTLLRHDKAGQVYFHLLQYKSETGLT